MKRSGVSHETQSLSAYLKNGDVILFESPIDLEANCNRTGVQDGAAVWNSSFTLLAVIGYKKTNRRPIAKFLNNQGYVLFTLTDSLPANPHARVSK